MSTTATLVYSVIPLGAKPSVVATALAAVPLPIDALNALGARVISDTTVVGPPLTRTVVLGLTPVVNAAGGATRYPGGSRGAIESIALTLNGSGYVYQPSVYVLDTPDPSGAPPGSGATAMCFLDVVSVAVTVPGTVYGVVPPVTFVGGLSPSGVAATGHATIGAGSVTGIVVDTSGSGYVSPPYVKIGPPGAGGTQAYAVADMEVGSVTLLGRGNGYYAPGLTFTPRFKTMFPDVGGAGSQAAPFANILKQIIEKSLCCPVNAAAPVIA